MKILFLHGWTSVPGGLKPSFLKEHGHEVLNPALPDEDFEGRRARREEKKLLLELLVEDIRRTKRERAAEQQRELTLEIEETPLP